MEANIKALTKGDGEILNIGSGTGVSVLGILDALRTVSGVDIQPEFAPARVGEVHKIYLDPSRAREVLGWSASVPPLDGIKHTYEYIKTQQSVD